MIPWNWVRIVLLAALLGGACGPRESGNNAASPAQPAPQKTGASTTGSLPAQHLDHIVALTNRGVALMDQFRPVEAVAAFEEVVALAPEWPTGRVNLAIALLNTEEEEHYSRAEEEFLATLAGDADNPYAHYSLGMLLRHLNRFDEAGTHFARVLDIDPDDADAHYQLGALLADTDPAAARRHLERALALTSHHASASYRLFTLMGQTGDMDGARDVLAVFQDLEQSGAGLKLGMRYGEMGKYASVVRVFEPSPISDGADVPLPVLVDVATAAGLSEASPGVAGWPGERLDMENPAATFGPGAAVADVDGDGDVDVLIPGAGGLYLNETGRFTKATDAGLDVRDAVAGFFGDYDKDGDRDLYLTCAGPNRLYANDGMGHFSDVTAETGVAGGAVLSLGAAWADADHDGDLDVYVANYCTLPCQAGATGAPNTLWRNNGDGTFRDTAQEAGIDGGNAPSVGVLFFDADADRDADLYVVNNGAANQLFMNDRIGRYHDGAAAQPALTDAGPGLGAVVGDVNLDGREDLLLLRGAAAPRLFLLDEDMRYVADTAFTQLADGVGGAVGGQFADLDLDGDLDILLTGAGGNTDRGHHLLLNDGSGRFRRGPVFGAADGPPAARGSVVTDFDDDGSLELLVAQAGAPAQLWRGPLPPGRHWFAIAPQVGIGGDGRPTPSGVGVHVEIKTGRHLQVSTIGSTGGYLGGPPARAHFGLGAHAKLDYVRLSWPDAVLQSELEVPADQTWHIAQMKRKPSSCPVLFAWDGSRFAFVTDFLGVGGLGFFMHPGEYGPPDPTEAVRIPPELIRESDGKYLLRIAEPLEEIVYLDEMHLVAYDHPADWEVYPDERFAWSPPWSTGEPLPVEKKIFPVAARTNRGEAVRDRVLAIDRQYVEPPLDLRFVGYAEDHWLELDFGDQLAHVPPDARLTLYLYSWVEYTYSHVNYAAHQAGLAMQPPAVEVPHAKGGWRTAISNAGYPAGLPRMMTVDVSALPLRRDGRLRLRTNMEVFWDQAFIGVQPDMGRLRRHVVRPTLANLQVLGYTREYSPDGRVPTLYDYHRLDQGVPFKKLTGAYTRLGDVRGLLAAMDDRFVIMNSGDELAVEFDARALSDLPPGWARTLVLHVDGYCKDMDLYTADPDQVEPLPYHAMDNYPPRTPYPRTPEAVEYQQTWNTRWIAGG